MDGILQFVVVCIFSVFWIFIFGRGLYRSITGQKKDIDRHTGRMVTGRILKTIIKGSGKMARTQILVEFPNFSNSDVQETFVFRDTKPNLNRYEEGNSVQLTLDEDPKKGPSVRLSGGKMKRSNGITFILFLLFAGSVYGAYFIYTSVDTQLNGNWNNLDQLPLEDGLGLTGVIFIVSLLFTRLVFRFVSKKTGQGSKGNQQKVKLYGIRSTAEINNIEETNVRVNDRPVIRFHYTFKDQFGTEHKGQDQMILDVIELSRVADITEKEILYLKDDPSNNRMMEALKGNMVSGCTKLVFLFMVFIFSIITFAMFFGSLGLI